MDLEGYHKACTQSARSYVTCPRLVSTISSTCCPTTFPITYFPLITTTFLFFLPMRTLHLLGPLHMMFPPPGKTSPDPPQADVYNVRTVQPSPSPQGLSQPSSWKCLPHLVTLTKLSLSFSSQQIPGHKITLFIYLLPYSLQELGNNVWNKIFQVPYLPSSFNRKGNCVTGVSKLVIGVTQKHQLRYP